MHRIAAVLLLCSLPACLFEDTSTSFDPPRPPPPNNNNNDPDDPPCDNCTSTVPLDFQGVQPVNPGFPDQANINNHIAVGGTHEVTPRLENDDTEFAYAYNTEIIDPAVLAVDTAEGPHLILRGVATGQSDLRVIEPIAGTLFDHAAYAMSTFDRAAVVGSEETVTSSLFTTPAQSYVFAPGKRRVGVAYLNAVTPANRLVDTSATLASAGATQTRWDEITFDNATVGTHAITVTVAGVETTVEIEVVDTADSVETLFTLDGIACFGAFKGSAFISGATWSIVVDGQPYVPQPGFELFGANCILVPAGPHMVTATAAGKSITIAMP